jgi:hypothetical protein
MSSGCGPSDATGGKAVPSPALSIIPSCSLDEGRAVPILFWLPMIFAGALLEMNGFPPQKPENNNPHALK